MIVQKSLMTDAMGNIVFSLTEDQTAYINNVQDAKNTNNGWTEERTMKAICSVPPREYHEWGSKLGYECWTDRDFLKFYKARNPQFFI